MAPARRCEERLLQLIRLDRWLQRRGRCRLWAETTGLATALACLADLLAALSLEWSPPDPACPIIDDFGRCLDTAGLSAWPVVLGWVIAVLLAGALEFIQWRRQGKSDFRR